MDIGRVGNKSQSPELCILSSQACKRHHVAKFANTVANPKHRKIPRDFVLAVLILHVKSQLWGSVCSKPAQMIQECRRSLSALKVSVMAGPWLVDAVPEGQCETGKALGHFSRDSDITYPNSWRRIWVHNSRKELAKSLPKESRCAKRLKKRARD